MPISVPEDPRNENYEDFVAAYFLGMGYFTEARRRLRREGTEILELDLVCSPSDEPNSDRLLVDAKSGDWGFTDIFKIFGWRTYLGIEQGTIVHREPTSPQKKEALDAVAAFTKVSDCQLLPKKTKFDEFETFNGLDAKLREIVVSSIWYYQIADRFAFEKFRAKCKTHEGDGPFESAYAYQFETEEIFFHKKPVRRVSELYRAFTEHHKLAGAFVDLEAKREKKQTDDVWSKVNNSSDLMYIQYTMMLEHRARLAIIKNGLDYHFDEDGRRVREQKIGVGLRFALPGSFITALEKLAAFKYASRVPYLIQIFIELFGGFYLKQERDLKLLSDVSGIPVADIPTALKLYDDFFPMGGKSWLYEYKDLVRMKVVPAYARGAGCFFRQEVYQFKKYEELSADTGRFLAGWHNALYSHLHPKLAVKDSQGRP